MHDTLFESLEILITKKGHLLVSYGPGGGLCWAATLRGEWPYCSGATMEGALKALVVAHARLEKEALQERINEIDASSGL